MKFIWYLNLEFIWQKVLSKGNQGQVRGLSRASLGFKFTTLQSVAHNQNHRAIRRINITTSSRGPSTYTVQFPHLPDSVVVYNWDCVQSNHAPAERFRYLAHEASNGLLELLYMHTVLHTCPVIKQEVLYRIYRNFRSCYIITT